MPAIQSIADTVYTFQQENAPAHRAYQTVQLLSHETPESTTLSNWTTYSPDLKSADYCI